MFKALTPIFAILASIAIFAFFIRPTFTDIRATQEETSQYAEAVSKATELNTELNALMSARNALGAKELERLEALVPDSVDQIQTVIELQRVANASGLLFTNIGVDLSKNSTIKDANVSGGGQTSGSASANDTSVTSDAFNTNDVSFSVIGTYDQFREFLKQLERSLSILEVEKIGFTVVDGDSQQYDVTVRGFALKPGAQPPSTQSPSTQSSSTQ